MKRFILVLVVFQISWMAFSQNYETVKVSGNGNLAWEYSVYAKDTNNIFAVGTSAIISSANGGLNWKTVYSSGSNSLRHIMFVDENIGYAVGGTNTSGTIVKTTDGGETWSEITPAGVNSWLQKCHFLNKDTGFVVGDSARLFKTTNGGVSFDKIPTNLPKKRTFFSVYFKNELEGIVGLKDSGMIMKTVDGGHTFTKVYEDNVNIFVNKICFPTSNTGYACGRYGTIVKSIDGGSTWIKQNSNTGQILWDMQFLNENLGFACGSGMSGTGLLFCTDDGGKTWFCINSRNPASKELRGLYLLNGNHGYAVQANTHEFTHIRIRPSEPKPIINSNNGILSTSAGSSYQWFCDNVSFTPKKTDSVSVVSSIQSLASKSYRVVVENDFKYSISTPFFNTPSELSVPSASNFNIFVENNTIHIQSDEQVQNLSVYDYMGKCIIKSSTLLHLPMNSIHGIYFVVVATKSGQRIKKIIL